MKLQWNAGNGDCGNTENSSVTASSGDAGGKAGGAGIIIGAIGLVIALPAAVLACIDIRRRKQSSDREPTSQGHVHGPHGDQAEVKAASAMPAP